MNLALGSAVLESQRKRGVLSEMTDMVVLHQVPLLFFLFIDQLIHATGLMSHMQALSL